MRSFKVELQIKLLFVTSLKWNFTIRNVLEFEIKTWRNGIVILNVQMALEKKQSSRQNRCLSHYIVTYLLLATHNTWSFHFLEKNLKLFLIKDFD